MKLFVAKSSPVTFSALPHPNVLLYSGTWCQYDYIVPNITSHLLQNFVRVCIPCFKLSGSETKVLQWLAKYCKILQKKPEIIQNEHPRNDQDHADGYHHPHYQVHHLLRHFLCGRISDGLIESVRLPHILISVYVVLDLTKVVCLHTNK